jgi:linoleoyl-CoA desaturase
MPTRECYLKPHLCWALYALPYLLIVTGWVSGVFLTLSMVVLMSLGLSGIGLCVMHDANHGAYSRRAWVNSMMGYSLNAVGASCFNWKVQHNVMHHTYTNVYGSDEDIGSRGVLRLSPRAKWRKFHKYQFIYAWFLYGFMTLLWMFFKDFEQLIRYQKSGFLKRQKTSAFKEWSILIGTKIFYIGYLFVIPVLFTPWQWWQVILGIMLMHYITGFMLAIIFQPAHVIEGTVFPEPDQNNTLRENWTIHQLRTTTNFANGNPVITWLVGGLNYQVEHHLFPGVCHVHFPRIASIVRATALEYDLPYKSVKTFSQALKGHLRMLKHLGQSSVK